MKINQPDAILRPGEEGWELWVLPKKGNIFLESHFTDKTIQTRKDLVLALPTRSVLAMPLWLSSQGDAKELAELELTSRHLLRKDAEVYAVPILEIDGRSLVLALAAMDDETSLAYVKSAKIFEIPARLLDPKDADVLVWKEQGGLCFSIYRDRECVFSASTGASNPDAGFASIIARTTLRLRAEGVVLRMPAKLRLIGDFLSKDTYSLDHVLRLECEIEKTLPAPNLPTLPSNAAPPTARATLASRAHLKRIALFGIAGLSAYALLLFVFAADLAWQRINLQHLDSELLKIEPGAATAQKLVTDWQQFRSCIDPQSFAIDLLAAVAAEIPGEQVRLTQYNYTKGRLSIAGEATDVSQAYDFFDRIKKASLLQDYDWTSGQPQLAGRNKVKFEMEGARPDAKTGEE